MPVMRIFLLSGENIMSHRTKRQGILLFIILTIGLLPGLFFQPNRTVDAASMRDIPTVNADRVDAEIHVSSTLMVKDIARLDIPSHNAVIGADKAADTLPPSVDTFQVNPYSSTLAIEITGFTASDDIGVTGYLITQSSTPPLNSDSGWTGSAPDTYTVGGNGDYTLYPWVKDAAGNVSAVFSAPASSQVYLPTLTPSVTNTPPVKYKVTVNKSPSGITGAVTASSGYGQSAVDEEINNCTASSCAGNYLLGTYLVLSAVPAAGYTFSGWSGGNCSGVGECILSIYSDTSVTANFVRDSNPLVETFAITSPSASYNLSITAFTASDDKGVTGYMVTESSTPPASTDTNWSVTVPTTYSVASAGSHVLYPWAKDADGNVSPVYGSPVTVVVDNTAPDTTISSKPSNPTNSTSASFSFTGDDGSGTGINGFECNLDSGGFSSCTSPKVYTVSEGSHTFHVRAVDKVGNADLSAASFTWKVDTSGPSVAMSSTALNPTNSSPIAVSVKFSENVTGLTAGDIVAGNGTIGNFIRTDDDSYAFNLIPGGQGSVTADIAAGSAVDAAGNGNSAATQFSRTYDTVGPTVTINQSAGQSDPTNSISIDFTVVFSESVADFETGDVTLNAGTTGATTAVVTGSGTTYHVAVSGMISDGFITVSIPAGVAHDQANNPNSASTSTDNQVLHSLILTAPEITSDDNMTFSTGHPGTFTVTTSGSPAGESMVLSEAGVLPGGVTFTDHHDGTATLAGTPVAGTAASYPITISAGNGVSPDASQSFTLTIVADAVPVITEGDTADISMSKNGSPVPFALTLHATDADTDPLTWSVITPAAVGNAGITAGSDAGTGVVTYTPPAEYTGTVSFVIQVSDGSGGTDSITVNVNIIVTIIANHPTLPDGRQLVNGTTLSGAFSEIRISFNQDAANPAGDTTKEDVTNPSNYLLVRPGSNDTFETVSCHAGSAGDDISVPTGPVTYENGGGDGPYIARVLINNGLNLNDGKYKLFICGTTSITDLEGNPLNGGLSDTVINFTIHNPTGSKNKTLPVTGFSPNRVSSLPHQPAGTAYSTYGDLTLDIPALGVKTSIVGVPATDDGWDITWLGTNAGYLNGTAFPTMKGNSVITGHVWNADNTPGIFADLKRLKYGDQIKIHAWGQIYTYEVLESKLVSPDNLKAMLKHEDQARITLITCENFVSSSSDYANRRIVRAVLTSVTSE
jgi:LPXTG-site transpeptidase (sortase) family protein